MAERRRFKYQDRTADQTKKRATQQGGMYDQPFKPEFKVFSPKEGRHRVRILPPTWDNPEHYGIDVWMVSNIGPDNQTYLSLSKMKGVPDPITEEYDRARREGDDEEYIASLKPYRRVLVWVIDRDNPDEGPMLWSMPWSIDKDVAALSIDDDTREVLTLDHPDDGYDIEFTKEGKGLQTKYVGLKIARKSTPLSDDEAEAERWLEIITQNPLPETLVYFDYEHIKKTFEGKSKKKNKDEDDEKPAKGPKTRREDPDDDDDDDDEPKPKKRPLDDEDDERPRNRKDEDEDRPKSKRELIEDPDEPLDQPRRKSREEDLDEKPARRRLVDDEDDERPRNRKDEDEDRPSLKDRVRRKLR